MHVPLVPRLQVHHRVGSASGSWGPQSHFSSLVLSVYAVLAGIRRILAEEDCSARETKAMVALLKPFRNTKVCMIYMISIL